MRRILPIVLPILLLLATCVHADELPTVESLQKLKADKQWSDLLKGATRLLALKGKQAEGIDRTSVWMLKAEAQLQSSQFVPASDSFLDASQEPAGTPEQADWAYAMSLVCRKSDAHGFRPPATKKNPAPQTFPIAEESGRKDAVQALFASELAECRDRLAGIKSPLPITAMGKLCTDAVDLRRVERAASGNTEQTDKLLIDITQRAGATTQQWCTSASTDIDKIDQTASEEERDDKGRKRPRGLTPADRKKLTEYQTTLREIAKDYETLNKKVADFAANDFKELPPMLEKLFSRIERMLDRSYLRTPR